MGQVGLKALFIGIVMVTNIVGIKAAGRANDVLTIVKLTPLALIIVGGIAYAAVQPNAAASHLTPFMTGGTADVGQALVLIFWAFAGFELSTLPADEVDRPESSIPRAIGTGMLVVTAFYLLTNMAVVISLDQSSLAASSSPLMDAAASIFSFLGGASSAVVLFVGAAALLSILGADESGTLGTSRLAYAMSIDGYLPHVLARLHPRFGTPYLSVIAIGVTAFIASLLGGIPALINSAVLLLGLVYLVTCISAMVLLRRSPGRSSSLRGRRVIPVAGGGAVHHVDPARQRRRHADRPGPPGDRRARLRAVLAEEGAYGAEGDVPIKGGEGEMGAPPDGAIPRPSASPHRHISPRQGRPLISGACHDRAMPELPEVETFKRYIERTSLRRPMVHLDVRNDLIIRGIQRMDLIDAVEGGELLSARRHGKWLFLELSGGRLAHLAFRHDRAAGVLRRRVRATIRQGAVPLPTWRAGLR